MGNLGAGDNGGKVFGVGDDLHNLGLGSPASGYVGRWLMRWICAGT